ncbi:MAG: hypothetical protein ACRD3M_13015, partial [Thermoanaerobaculia bacterium]
MTTRLWRLLSALVFTTALLPMAAAIADPQLRPGDRFSGFGDNGEVSVPMHAVGSIARAVVVAPGTTDSAYAVGSSDGDLLVTRFDPRVTVGTSRYYVSWRHFLRFPVAVEGRAAALTGDGSLLAGADGEGGFAFARYGGTGTIDQSFGSRGQVTTPLGASARLAGIYLRPDGSFLAGGTVDGQPVLVGYRADGQLNASFGSGGVNRLPGGPLELRAMGGDSGGNVALAGTSDGNLVVVRVDAAGQIDATFGDHGFARSDLGGDDILNSVAIDGAGRVVAGGVTARASGRQAVVWRLTASGQPDANFGAGGAIVTALRDGDGAVEALTLLADDRILVVGEAGGDIVAARFLTNGAPDGGFVDGSADWVARNHLPGGVAEGVALDAEGYAVFVGELAAGNDGRTREYGFGVFFPNGFQGRMAPDPLRYSSISSLATYPDGRILAAGSDWNATDFGISRFRADGAVDTSFGRTGRLNTDIGPQDRFRKVFALPDGGALAAGRADTRIAAVRYRPDGSLDPSFGDNGVVLIPIPGPIYGGSSGVARDDHGRLLLAWSYGDVHADKLVIFRILADGSLDPSFGTAGRVITAFDGGIGVSNMATVLDDRLLILARTSEAPSIRVLRYREDGTPDSSFGIAGESAVPDAAGRVYALEPMSGGAYLLADGFRLSRYDDHGRLDPSFGQSGVTEPIDFPPETGDHTEAVGDIVVADDGSIIAVGQADLAPVIVRYGHNGAVDRAFGSSGILREERPSQAFSAVLVLSDGSI